MMHGQKNIKFILTLITQNFQLYPRNQRNTLSAVV